MTSHLLPAAPQESPSSADIPASSQQTALRDEAELFMHVRGGVECLLFVSGSPLGAREMALALDADEDLVARAAEDLTGRGPDVSGLSVVRVAGGWQMVTRPEHAIAIARFVGKRAQKLSRAALETLAILAYNQPCTLPEMESIRGVDCSGVIKSLSERGLVREIGRKEGPGRPIIYGTTDDFLVYFGLNSLEDLPDQEALERAVSEKAAEESAAGDDTAGQEAAGENPATGAEPGPAAAGQPDETWDGPPGWTV